jgi:hypothetical protein
MDPLDFEADPSGDPSAGLDHFHEAVLILRRYLEANPDD